MNLFIIILSIYAIIVFAGGLVGYIVAGSAVSIAMSSIFALAFVVVISTLKNFPKQSFLTSAILTLILLTVFSMRFYSTQSFMPGGLMAILSLLLLGFHYFSRLQYLESN